MANDLSIPAPSGNLLTEEEIEAALDAAKNLRLPTDPERLHEELCGEIANHPIACQECKRLALVLQVAPRALRSLQNLLERVV